MDSSLAFLSGFFMAGVTVFVVTAVTVWMPRLKHLQTERNIWRNRALVAEDQATPFEPDIRLVGDWGSATDGWVDDEST